MITMPVYGCGSVKTAALRVPVAWLRLLFYVHVPVSGLRLLFSVRVPIVGLRLLFSVRVPVAGSRLPRSMCLWFF